MLHSDNFRMTFGPSLGVPPTPPMKPSPTNEEIRAETKLNMQQMAVHQFLNKMNRVELDWSMMDAAALTFLRTFVARGDDYS